MDLHASYLYDQRIGFISTGDISNECSFAEWLVLKNEENERYNWMYIMLRSFEQFYGNELQYNGEFVHSDYDEDCMDLRPKKNCFICDLFTHEGRYNLYLEDIVIEALKPSRVMYRLSLDPEYDD